MRGLGVKLNPQVEPEALVGLQAQCVPQMPAAEPKHNLGFAVREQDLPQGLHALAVLLVELSEYIYLILTGSTQIFKLLLFKDTGMAADRRPGHMQWLDQSRARLIAALQRPQPCSPGLTRLLTAPSRHEGWGLTPCFT